MKKSIILFILSFFIIIPTSTIYAKEYNINNDFKLNLDNDWNNITDFAKNLSNNEKKIYKYQNNKNNETLIIQIISNDDSQKTYDIKNLKIDKKNFLHKLTKEIKKNKTNFKIDNYSIKNINDIDMFFIQGYFTENEITYYSRYFYTIKNGKYISFIFGYVDKDNFYSNENIDINIINQINFNKNIDINSNIKQNEKLTPENSYIYFKIFFSIIIVILFIMSILVIKKIIFYLNDSNEYKKQCLKEYNYIKKYHTEYKYIFNLIENSLKKELKDKDKLIYTIEKEKASYTDVIWILISNLTSDLLITGKYHLYRGLLTHTGNELLKLFLLSIEKLHESNFYNDDKVHSEKKWIFDNIKILG